MAISHIKTIQVLLKAFEPSCRQIFSQLCKLIEKANASVCQILEQQFLYGTQQQIQSVTIETLNNMNRNLSFEFRRSHHPQSPAIQQHRIARREVMNEMLADYGLPFFHHSHKHVQRCPPPQSTIRPIQTSPYLENRLQSNSKLQNDVHLSPKHHRKTLPANLSPPNFIQPHKVLQPMASPKGTPVRISFSYSNQPKQRIAGTILLASITSSPQSLSQQGQPKRRKQKREEKQTRCKISSNEFNQCYAPLKFSKKVQKRSAIGHHGIYRSQPHIKTPEMLKSFQYNPKELRNEGINSSKMASTEATQSFHENKISGLSSVRQLVGSSQRLSNEFPSKKAIDYDSSKNLISQMSSGKILNKTILFGMNYDFGGLMAETNSHKLVTNASIAGEKQVNSGSFKQVEDRHWKSHVKCLLSSQHEGDNMKQSIHCGPDVRHQRFKCQALNGFGRQIKQSYIPNNE